MYAAYTPDAARAFMERDHQVARMRRAGGSYAAISDRAINGDLEQFYAKSLGFSSKDQIFRNMRKAQVTNPFSKEKSYRAQQMSAPTVSGSVGDITRKERAFIIVGKALAAGVVAGALSYVLFMDDSSKSLGTPLGAFKLPIAIGGTVAIAEALVDTTMLFLPPDKVLGWDQMLYGALTPVATVAAGIAVGYFALNAKTPTAMLKIGVAAAGASITAGYVETKWMNPYALAN